MDIKRLLLINVPIKNCNLKCDYCYINALNETEAGSAIFNFSPEHVGKCLTKDRLGGTCIINLTGGGETLIPKEVPRYIYELLAQGHYLEVVTNGTISSRFDEIIEFPANFLKRLEFKFSFHYKELIKLNLVDSFFNNIKKVSSAGCSFTVELMPYDELIPCIDDIISICRKELGAVCQVTVGRNDLTNNKQLLTKLSKEEYEKIWSVFDSEMFRFKLDIFSKKIGGFCYAGLWSLYINLGTGETKPCYSQLCNQNVFKDPDADILFCPVGKHCRQPYCYNGHALLTLGLVPELSAPCYSKIRNRVTNDGNNWLSEDVMDAFSQKLYDSNDVWDMKKRILYECAYPFRLVRDSIYDRNNIYKKIMKKKG